MSYKIFETGMYDYSDDPRVNVTKPVLYTPQFFEEMIKELESVPLDIQHKGENVGSLTNINFTDNALFADANTEQSLKDKGISPVFEYDTIDRGGYLEAVNGVFTGAGITKTPRSTIIYNSNDNNGSENMVSEEAFEQISKQNRKLERELATKDNQLKANADKLAELEELKARVKTLETDYKKATDELEEIRPYAQKYSDYETQRKESLLDEIAGDDAGVKEELSDWDIEKLEFLKSNRTVTTEPQGVSSNGAEGQNEGDGEEPPSNDGKPSLEEIEKDYATLYGED